MKKYKKKREPVSGGKKFINAVHRLFKAKDPVAVHKAMNRCLVRARTLTHIRALYSWVVSNHGLSAVNFHEETPYVIQRVIDRWEEMTLYVLRNLPPAHSCPDLWRTLYGLCQSSTRLGCVIALEWNNSFRKVKSQEFYYIKHVISDGHYLEALKEVLRLTPPQITPKPSMVLGC